jgi:hypothetical protein
MAISTHGLAQDARDLNIWAHTAPDGTVRNDSRSKRLLTSEMTPRELAKAVAEWHGWYGYQGSIYPDAAHRPYAKNERPDRRGIASGWDRLALVLKMLGIIEVGVGIHWKRQHEIHLAEKGSYGTPPEVRDVIAKEVSKMKAGKRRMNQYA